MIRLITLWLEKLGCRHEWVQESKVHVYDVKNGGERPFKIRLLFICKKCGKFKKVSIHS